MKERHKSSFEYNKQIEPSPLADLDDETYSRESENRTESPTSLKSHPRGNQSRITPMKDLDQAEPFEEDLTEKKKNKKKGMDVTSLGLKKEEEKRVEEELVLLPTIKRRNLVINELIITERDYVLSLQKFIHMFGEKEKKKF